MKHILTLLLLTLSLFASIPQGGLSFDALGNTRALTDTYTYTPYGKLSSHEGTSENSFLFTGEQYDKEMGNYYLRARYYSPELARFLSRDTFEGTLTDPLSQNRYLYARGNPAVYVDPSGHMSMVEVTFDVAAMEELETVNFEAAFILRKMMEDATCVVVKEGIDYTIKEGIYLWITHEGKVYVGKSNDSIERRIKSHVQKKAKIFNKQLARIGLKLPPQLLETIEEAIMEELGFENKKNPGYSANSRHNYSPNKPNRRRAYKKYKRLLDKLCK